MTFIAVCKWWQILTLRSQSCRKPLSAAPSTKKLSHFFLTLNKNPLLMFLFCGAFSMCLHAITTSVSWPCEAGHMCSVTHTCRPVALWRAEPCCVCAALSLLQPLSSTCSIPSPLFLPSSLQWAQQHQLLAIQLLLLQVLWIHVTFSCSDVKFLYVMFCLLWRCFVKIKRKV